MTNRVSVLECIQKARIGTPNPLNDDPVSSTDTLILSLINTLLHRFRNSMCLCYRHLRTLPVHQ